MTFASLVAGDAVFVDANTFVYHFAPDPHLQIPCSQLLDRIENQELTGFTSTPVVAEVAHRLMTIEARAQLGWTVGKTVQRLKQNPRVLSTLANFRNAVASILQSRIQVLLVPPALILSVHGHQPAIRLAAQ